MAVVHEDLLRDAFNVMLDAGIAPEEILGLVLQVHFALTHVHDDRVPVLFYEQRLAKGR